MAGTSPGYQNHDLRTALSFSQGYFGSQLSCECPGEYFTRRWQFEGGLRWQRGHHLPPIIPTRSVEAFSITDKTGWAMLRPLGSRGLSSAEHVLYDFQYRRLHPTALKFLCIPAQYPQQES
jgi:hypothetical protein